MTLPTEQRVPAGVTAAYDAPLFAKSLSLAPRPLSAPWAPRHRRRRVEERRAHRRAPRSRPRQIGSGAADVRQALCFAAARRVTATIAASPALSPPRSHVAAVTRTMPCARARTRTAAVLYIDEAGAGLDARRSVLP
ncbi:uncharacterized protein LOC125226121 [Leguminivora glycinivorella]|uniref:uncharacterized protein LOC125226121 n=1 Tax=Leguminivora glycinivorella TaxID=1035111 RepID=UPI00200D790B|nr:uncharacterized protein LOC125226121 [Leguminivora glycinivorella]XP_047985965.1 uncharacterized protein LOC125226121 [Leguminivora glycinivorella]